MILDKSDYNIKNKYFKYIIREGICSAGVE